MSDEFETIYTKATYKWALRDLKTKKLIKDPAPEEVMEFLNGSKLETHFTLRREEKELYLELCKENTALQVWLSIELIIDSFFEHIQRNIYRFPSSIEISEFVHSMLLDFIREGKMNRAMLRTSLHGILLLYLLEEGKPLMMPPQLVNTLLDETVTKLERQASMHH